MGTKITEKKGLYAALNNCAFVSTQFQDLEKFIKSFSFLMDSAMIGVGVGFDTKGSFCHHTLQTPDRSNTEIFTVPDTREGWVQSLEFLLRSYLKPQ